MGRVKYSIVKNIACWKVSDSETLEFKIIKWANNPEKYDLRKWSNGEPKTGVTIPKERLEDVFIAIGEELDYEINSGESPEPDPEPGLEPGPELDPDPEPEAFEITPYEEIDFRDFFVYGSVSGCGYPNHTDKELVRAKLPILSGIGVVKETELSAIFCRECGVYYITQSEYDRISKEGRIICQLLSEKEYLYFKNNRNHNQFDYLPESILHRFGYNASEKDDYSDNDRQQILTTAISLGVVSKRDAIGLIKTLIYRNEKNYKNRNAVEKWRKDLAFLNGFDPDEYIKNKRLIGVKRIIKPINS